MRIPLPQHLFWTKLSFQGVLHKIEFIIRYHTKKFKQFYGFFIQFTNKNKIFMDVQKFCRMDSHFMEVKQ